MKPIYVKYNRERLPQFQTETTILKSSQEMAIRKRALLPEGIEHIERIYKNYVLMKEHYKNIKIAKADFSNDEICIEYINGVSFSKLLIDTILQRNKAEFFYCLQQFYNLLKNMDSYIEEKFVSSGRFVELFGLDDVCFERVTCSSVSNIDMIFDNVLYDQQGNYSIIDYEWVFDFPLPIGYVFFRSITEFFTKNKELLKGFISVSEVFDYFSFSKYNISVFEEMEKGFQNYVFGQKRLLSVSSRYIKCKVNVQEELQDSQSFLKRKEEVQHLRELLNQKEAHIELLMEQERTLHNILNSREWKLIEHFKAVRDRVFPIGTKRRFFTKLMLRTAKNPRLMFSKVNLHNLKVFMKHVKSNEITSLENKIQNQLNLYTPVKTMELRIFESDDIHKKINFPKHTNPLVSIIIPVYNKWEYTYSCLLSILEHTQDVSYEIILADDMSSDDTVQAASIVENITIVRDGTNRGFLLNCNNASKAACGKYMLFLNNDTNVQEGWLKALVDIIERDETIGMVGSKLVYADGRLQEAGGIIWNDASGWNYGRLDDPDRPEYNYVKEVDYISGASIMIRSDLWNEIGGFDERYVPAYYEDSDLAFEVRKHGYKVIYQPKSVVVHFEGISHGTDTNSGIKSYQIKNKEKFVEKWKDVLENEHFPNAEHVFWARDRSRDKKTIVVIDHYVPHYDKDAGGRCTYQYLKLFRYLGFNVIFIGDNFYNHEPYTSELQQYGIQVLYGDWYLKNYKEWIKKNGQYIDYAYLNRPHISIKYIDILRKYTDCKVVYFGHDLHYLRELRNYEIEKKEELLTSSNDWKKIEFKLFEKADVVYVVGSYEQKILQEEFIEKPIRNIPLYIFESEKKMINKNYAQTKDILFVGGFNHKPNYDGVLWFCNEVFPSIREQIPGVKIYIVGSNPQEEIKALQTDQIIVTGYVSDEELENYYRKCRVVAVPLRYGAGVKGKVVEALYHQVPIVTTSIGAEGLQDIENHLLIGDNANDFAQKVVELYQNQTVWERLSISSGDYVEKYFSKESAIEQIEQDFTR